MSRVGRYTPVWFDSTNHNQVERTVSLRMETTIKRAYVILYLK